MGDVSVADTWFNPVFKYSMSFSNSSTCWEGRKINSTGLLRRSIDQISGRCVVSACVCVTSCSEVTMAAFSAVNRSKMAYRKPRSRRRSISWINTLKYLPTTFITSNDTNQSETQIRLHVTERTVLDAQDVRVSCCSRDEAEVSERFCLLNKKKKRRKKKDFC